MTTQTDIETLNDLAARLNVQVLLSDWNGGAAIYRSNGTTAGYDIYRRDHQTGTFELESMTPRLHGGFIMPSDWYSVSFPNFDRKEGR